MSGKKLQSVLRLAARGREQPGDLGLLSWAASGTRPALFDQLVSHGLAFTSAGLFACGLKLREEGWDMQQRLAQLQSNPGDVDTLRALLPVAPGEPAAVVQSLAAPTRRAPEDDGEAFNPWLDHAPLDGNAPDWHEEPVGDVPAGLDPLEIY